MVVIGLQLFKGDPNKENLTKLEHVYIYTYTYAEGIWYCNIPILLFKPGDKNDINHWNAPAFHFISPENMHDTKEVVHCDIE